jgi:NhaP-type Na+/H+ or K+/H+ antiporter
MLYVFAFAGVVLALIFGITSVADGRWYAMATATLLAVGLFSSTFGISLAEARRHLKLILSAVTIGVLLKACIIGTVLSIWMRSPFGYILGVIVAQIDPLSTAALQRGKRLSARAKTILGAWASFDDPITVILSLYVPVAITAVSGIVWPGVAGSLREGGLGGYLRDTGLQLAFAGAAFVLWMAVRRYTRARNYIVLLFAGVAAYALLALSLSVAVYLFWMLGVAVIGLFMRPDIGKLLDRVVQWALCLAALLLGVLMAGGVDVKTGVVLGVAAYAAQMLVGYVLCWRLRRKDRYHIALAQQNGITAVILALLFEPYYPGTIAIVGPAVLVINALHLVANYVLDRYVTHDAPVVTLRQRAELVRVHFSRT